MQQTPGMKQIDLDWGNNSLEMTNEQGEGNLNDFVGEYLRNANGMRDIMIVREKYDNEYVM